MDKKLIIGGAILLVLGALVGYILTPMETGTVGSITTESISPSTSSNFNNVGFKDSDSDEVTVTGTEYGTLSISGATGTASFYNGTGQTIYVKDFIFDSGAANTVFSKTLKVATSSTATPSTISFATIIDSALLATSAPRTVFNSYEDQGTLGEQIVPVAAGEYVTVQLAPFYGTTTTSALTTSTYSFNWLTYKQ